MGVKLKERRPGQWWLYVDHKGKRFAKKLGGDKRTALGIKREVERRLTAGDLHVGPTEEPTLPTFERYADTYLNNAEATLKYSTWKDYRGNLKKHLLPAVGTLPLDQITRARVKELAFSLRHGGLKPKTVRKVIGTLGTILAEAVDDGVLDANPAAGMKKVYRADEFKGSGRDINPLTHEELAHLLETAETHAVERGDQTVHPYRRHRLFLLLLARTGLRLGEAIGLKWGDVDLHGGFLTVQRNVVRGRVTTPKNKKSRQVDLSDHLRLALTAAREERFGKVVALNPQVQAEREAVAGVADAWIFTVDGGGYLDPDNFRARVWEPLLIDANLRKVRLHDLRHTYASLLLQDGVELLYVSQQLGHHSAAFTLQVYGHLLPRDRRGEVNRLDRPATIRNPDATSFANGVLPKIEKARNSLESQAL